MFESCRGYFAHVAQLAEAPSLNLGCCQFESDRGHHAVSVQVNQGACKALAAKAAGGVRYSHTAPRTSVQCTRGGMAYALA